MRRSARSIVMVVAAAVTCSVIATASSLPDHAAERIRADIAFLASDLLEGRETATRGFDIAAEYVAAQFRQIGVLPAGDDGTYLQRVALVAFRATDEGHVVLRGRDGRTVPLRFGEDYLPPRSSAPETRTISGALVLAGYGVVAPEHNRDDYSGLDVRDKIAVVLSGAPLDIPTEERAYYASGRVGEKQFRDFLAGCYHRPCDDVNHPIDYDAGAKFARVNYEIARELANAPSPPSWKCGDFFATKFAPAL